MRRLAPSASKSRTTTTAPGAKQDTSATCGRPDYELDLVHDPFLASAQTHGMARSSAREIPTELAHGDGRMVFLVYIQYGAVRFAVQHGRLWMGLIT